MTKTIELTSPMIDALGVSLSGLECETESGLRTIIGTLNGKIHTNLMPRSHQSITVPAHALVVKVLEQLEKRCGSSVEDWCVSQHVDGDWDANYVFFGYVDHCWDDSFFVMPSWFCSLFTKARKVAGKWVIE